jgi:4-amino-4-deoxy-L-arabinose transferase-like glycosyltransferase
MAIGVDAVLKLKKEIKIKNWKFAWKWEQVGLGGILLLSAFLGLWNLSANGYSNQYYAAAVRSMMQSWHNFFFASFDPGGFVTVDKPPVAFWLQTAYATVFGYSGVDLLVPEALAGVGGVFLLYRIMKRAFGTAAGLLSALMLAVTPVFVLMNRDNNPDSILVFFLILAAWAMLRAAEQGKLGWLLLSGALVGVAFNTKMLVAFIVLPAFYLMYFLFARTGWFKRVWQLALLSVVIGVVSFSWPLAVELTPPDQRPYVDSTATNSELDLIFNYNGLGRINGNERGGLNGGGGGFTFPGFGNNNSSAQVTPATNSNANRTTRQPNTNGTVNAGGNNQLERPGFGGATNAVGNNRTGQSNNNANTSNNQTTQSNSTFNNASLNQIRPGGGGNFGGGRDNNNEWLRLIVPQLAGEFNWFMPLALLGLFYVGIQSWFGLEKGEERSRRLQAVALWGGWLLTFGVVFTISKGTFHSYYLNVMAPAGAALAGGGVITLWRRYRQGGWLAWFLPAGLAAAAFYQAYILTGFTSWNAWLGPVLIVIGICAVIGLALGRVFHAHRFGLRLARGVVWVTVAGLLVTPAVWSIRLVFSGTGGALVTALPTGGAGGVGFGFGFGAGNPNPGIAQAWLDFVQNNLSGQLLLALVIVVVAALLVGIRFLLRKFQVKRQFLNLPVVSGVLLALFLLSSTGWWINVAHAQTNQTTRRNFGGPGGFGGGNFGGSNSNNSLLQYLEANQGDYKYLLAVSNSNSAAPLIIETGKPVMSLGGFLGSDRIITSTQQLQELVASHTVRYFQLGGGGRGGSSQITQWVQQNCQAVNSSQYSASGSNSAGRNGGNFGFGGFGGGGLYMCGNQ